MDERLATLFNDLMSDLRKLDDNTAAEAVGKAFNDIGSTRDLVINMRDTSSEIYKAIPREELQKSEGGREYLKVLEVLSGPKKESEKESEKESAEIPVPTVNFDDPDDEPPELVLVTEGTAASTTGLENIMGMVEQDVPYLANFLKDNMGDIGNAGSGQSGSGDFAGFDMEKLIATMQTKIDSGDVDEQKLETESLALINKLMEQVDDPSIRMMVQSIIS